MTLVKNIAKQNNWRVLGTFVDEFNFDTPQMMYLLDRTYNWRCPFRDSCESFRYSEPCLFLGTNVVCLRCCTDRFQVIWYGETSQKPLCHTLQTPPDKRKSGCTVDTDGGCEDFPQIDLCQRAEIHNAGRKASLDEINDGVQTARQGEDKEVV